MKTAHYVCSNIIQATADIRILTAKPLESDKITFKAGQYVEALLQNGVRLPLSIANIPNDSGELEFHIRHNANHLLATQWLNEITHSKTFVLQGPKGRCTLDRIVPGTNIIFLAGGTGYAPIRSLLQSLFERDVENIPPLYFYWGVTHPDDAYDLNAILHWQKHASHFHADIVLSQHQTYTNWQGARGWVHEHCANQHPSFKDTMVFASGPYEMIQAAYQRFTAMGLPASHFISDMLET